MPPFRSFTSHSALKRPLNQMKPVSRSYEKCSRSLKMGRWQRTPLLQFSRYVLSVLFCDLRKISNTGLSSYHTANTVFIPSLPFLLFHFLLLFLPYYLFFGFFSPFPSLSFPFFSFPFSFFCSLALEVGFLECRGVRIVIERLWV